MRFLVDECTGPNLPASSQRLAFPALPDGMLRPLLFLSHTGSPASIYST